MKRIFSLTIAILLIISMAVSMTACGGDSGKNSITFMYGGGLEVSAMFNKLIQEFNDTAGQELGIQVKGVPKSTSLSSVLAQQLPSANGPDVVILQDEYFKGLAESLEDLTPNLDATVINDFYPNLVNRYYYNVETNTSSTSDPLYAVPVYSDTTVLYYNKTALEAVGVVCISVPADQIEAFNGGAADLNGKTKADYGLDIEIPAKGYYRSELPFVPADGEVDGSSWEKPEDEILVFNDQISMNWDEIEDLGMLCTRGHNADSKTKYGYYTEWWFNYAWSVGGDCLEDLDGKGDWTYSLANDVPNFIVGEGKSYTGIYTGTAYTEGETLDFKDVLEAAAGDAISYATDGKTYYYFTVNGAEASYRDFSDQIADGTLTELPSTSDAFARFANLAGEGGMNVCPSPAIVGSSTPLYFTSGDLALMVERLSFYSSIEKGIKDDWGIAPLPQYKQYEEPEDPDNDTIVAEGKAVGHSHGYCVGVSKKSDAKDASYAFVNWLSTKGQEYLSQNSYVSCRQSDRATAENNLALKNAGVVLDTTAAALAGDWWYMTNRGWIDIWASPLNYNVRYGKMSLEKFMFAYIEETNTYLDNNYK